MVNIYGISGTSTFTCMWVLFFSSDSVANNRT